MARVKQLCQCGKLDCQGHSQRKASKADYRATKHERYGSQWPKLSRLYRVHNPLCQVCEAEGRTTPAVDVHHIQKVSDRPDLLLDWDNLLSVCRKCHKKLDAVQ